MLFAIQWHELATGVHVSPIPKVFPFNVYCSIVDLQCCVIFCFTAKWVSYTFLSVHSILDYFPIQVIADYWVKFPVPCSRFLLVISFIYSSMYMLITVFDVLAWFSLFYEVDSVNKMQWIFAKCFWLMKAKVPSKKLRCHFFFFEGLVIFLYTSCLVSQSIMCHLHLLL